MVTAFQTTAFQSTAFQIAAAVASAQPDTGGGHSHSFRYLTRKQIEQLEREEREREAAIEAHRAGTRAAVTGLFDGSTYDDDLVILLLSI